jgi:large subunit ribosomal protein L27
MAHKKAMGSTQNGRDSVAKRRGVKVFGGDKVIAGNIIVRQKGNVYWPGSGVGQGDDFTLFALQEGTVSFSEKRRKRYDGRVFNDVYVSVI